MIVFLLFAIVAILLVVTGLWMSIVGWLFGFALLLYISIAAGMGAGGIVLLVIVGVASLLVVGYISDIKNKEKRQEENYKALAAKIAENNKLYSK